VTGDGQVVMLVGTLRIQMEVAMEISLPVNEENLSDGRFQWLRTSLQHIQQRPTIPLSELTRDHID
jgi:hypothetical protein